MGSKLFVFFCVFGLMLGTTACTLTITPPAPAQRSANRVIFTAEEAEAYRNEINAQAAEFWTPADADVAALETDLPAFLQTAEHPWLRPSPPIWERVPDYQRQDLGILEEGERVIYANFFCNAHDIDWENELVFILDGGDCYFQVKYNVESGEFYDLSVNGEA